VGLGGRNHGNLMARSAKMSDQLLSKPAGETTAVVSRQVFKRENRQTDRPGAMRRTEGFDGLQKAISLAADGLDDAWVLEVVVQDDSQVVDGLIEGKREISLNTGPDLRADLFAWYDAARSLNENLQDLERYFL
jgi:hypothetical protein